MNLIARSEDLNSPEVLEKLKIEGIEKFNPDNPDLPENVRARLDELAAEGKTIGAFYDKTTNKIFVNENLEDDAEIRASIAREWKIAEDLNAQKGKVNEAGQLKSTVAGELAYDDILKRSREGKTGSISTDELKEAVMDMDSEVTADGWFDVIKTETAKKVEDVKQTIKKGEKLIKNGIAEVEYQGKKIINNTKIAYYTVTGNQQGVKNSQAAIKNDRTVKDNKQKQNEKEAKEYIKNSERRKQEYDKNLIVKQKRESEQKKATQKIKDEIARTKDPVKRKELKEELKKVEPRPIWEGLKSFAKTTSETVVLLPFKPAMEKAAVFIGSSVFSIAGAIFLLVPQTMGSNDQIIRHPELSMYSKSEAEYIKKTYPQYYRDNRISEKTTNIRSSFDKNQVDLEIIGSYGNKYQKEEEARIIGGISGIFAGNVASKGVSKLIGKINKDITVNNTSSLGKLENPKIDNKMGMSLSNKAVVGKDGNYYFGRSSEWSLPESKTPYVELGNKGQGLTSAPKYNVLTGEYTRNYDIFYRSISKEDYGILKSTGNLKGTGETSTSPNLEFTNDYTGVQIKFYTKQGTIGEMEKIGVRGNAGVDLREKYPNMPRSYKGWGLENVQFKQETGEFNKSQINIQLGKEGGKGLEIFNQNLKGYEVIKENK